MAKKLSINAVAMSNFRRRMRQYLALIVSIVMAMIFSSGIPFFISCAESSKTELRHRATGKQAALLVDAQDAPVNLIEDTGMLTEPISYIHIRSYAWTEDREKGMTVGWLEEDAEKQYYLQIREGRMPQSEGEIALEQTQLLRLGLEHAAVGETITLHESGADGSGYLDEVREQTYTLCGILENRKSVLEENQGDTRGIVAKIPSAFVSRQQPPVPGGRAAMIGLLSFQERGEELGRVLVSDEILDKLIETIYLNQWGSRLDPVQSASKIAISVTVLLAFLSCFGIANAFAANLNERKRQIGLLRAVGATKQQIVQIYGREAVLIALITAPLSILLSYFSVKLFAQLMGNSFLFLPDVRILLIGGLFGFAAVLMSAVIPLLRACRIPPMQAIRDVEFVRKMRSHRIRSQERFQADRLLARRKLMFMPVRQIALSLILAFATVILFGVIGQSMQWLHKLDEVQNPYDYEISLHRGYIGKSPFVNELGLNDSVTETQRQDTLALGYVQEVSGQKAAKINLRIDGEFPDYLELNEYASWVDGNSRFRNLSGIADETGSALTKENLRQIVHQYPNPDYEAQRAWGGYAEEIYAAPFYAQSSEWMQRLSPYVREGKIDIDKLNLGEEVILNAPEKVGFYFSRSKSGSSSMGLMDLSADALEVMTASDRQNMDHILVEADCPYHAGDLLNISMLTMGSDGEPIREDRTVRIGAIISNPRQQEDVHFRFFSRNEFSVHTTVAGLDQFGQPFGYDGVKIRLNTEVTEQIDHQMQTELAALYPGKNVFSNYAANQRARDQFVTESIVLGSLVVVLCAVSISLVNHSISAQIREGERMIGTLRAVGASRRDIRKIYQRQLIPMTGAGVLFGMIFYLISCGYLYFRYNIQVLNQNIGTFVLWPAPILFAVLYGICRLHLENQIRKVIGQSIVENIREL